MEILRAIEAILRISAAFKLVRASFVRRNICTMNVKIIPRKFGAITNSRTCSYTRYTIENVLNSEE